MPDSILMTRPRGRPRQYDPDTALDAAMRLFWEKGYAATSLTDLCEVTGMKRPSLYAAFGDKHAIYTQALERYEGMMRDSMGRVLMGEPELERALTKFFFAGLDLHFASKDAASEAPQLGCMVVSTAGAVAARDEVVRELMRGTIGRLDGLLGERMRQAEAAGQIPEGSAGPRGAVAVAVLHSLSVRARAGHSRRALRKFVRESVALLVGGAGERQGG